MKKILRLLRIRNIVTLYEEKELTGVYDMITILGEIVT